jgi:benzoyl-CoA reductase subunit B
MKELRKELAIANAQASDRGAPTFVGVIETFLGILAGVGEYAMWQYEPRFTARMRDPIEAAKNFEAIESYGFGSPMCNSLRIQMGGVFRGSLDKVLKGRKPDFVFESGICAQAGKAAQFMAEYLGIPVIQLECPDKEYLLIQLHEMIELMEKVLGRPYDDELLIEAARNQWECSVLWSEISQSTRNVPAPIDFRHMQSLRAPSFFGQTKSHVVAYFRDVRDEVKDRMAQGISARGFEDARLLFEGFPPYHHANVLRWPEKFGAIVVGGSFAGAGGAVDDDGTTTQRQTWEARGNPLRNRDDALRAMIDLYRGNDRRLGSDKAIESKSRDLLWRIKGWRVNGVIMAMERECPPQYIGMIEQMLVMRQNNVPCIEFAPSQTDARQFNIAQARNRIESFLEQLGLHKEEEPKVELDVEE